MLIANGILLYSLAKALTKILSTALECVSVVVSREEVLLHSSLSECMSIQVDRVNWSILYCSRLPSTYKS